MKRLVPVLERLLSKIEIGPVFEGSLCWMFTGGDNGRGYGKLRVGTRKMRAHRVAFEEMVGPIPDGMTIDHLCRRRLCVNPAHLEVVSFYENLMRGDTIAARNAARQSCTRCGAQLVRGTRQRRCPNASAHYRRAA